MDVVVVVDAVSAMLFLLPWFLFVLVDYCVSWFLPSLEGVIFVMSAETFWWYLVVLKRLYMQRSEPEYSYLIPHST